jgi:hypothetical protein
MSRRLINFIAVIGMASVALLFVSTAHAQTVPTNLWRPNYTSSTIAPINSALQIPCANVVGGCNASSGAVSSLSGTPGQVNVSQATGTVTLSLPQNVNTTSSPTFAGVSATGNVTSTSFSAVGSTVASYFPIVFNYYYFPTPSMLAAGTACGTTLGVTEVGNCFNDIYATVASGTQVFVGPYSYVSSTWTTEIAENVNQKFMSLSCVPNATAFYWGGTGTSTVWNYGNSGSASGYAAHTYAVGTNGCSFYGGNPNATTTFAVLGGNYGAEGITFANGRIQGFGLALSFSNNVYFPTLFNMQLINNGQNINDPSGLTNSNERVSVISSVMGDVGGVVTTSTLTNCISLSSVSEIDFTNTSIDDCGVNAGAGTIVSVSGGHGENAAAQSNPSYPAYSMFTFAAGDTGSLTGFNFLNDASSTTSTPANFVQNNGGFLTFTGDTEGANASLGAATLNTFVSETGNGSTQFIGVVNNNGSTYGTNSSTFTPFYSYASSTATGLSANGSTYCNGTTCGYVGLANNGASSFNVGTTVGSHSIQFTVGGSTKGVINASGLAAFGGSTATTTLQTDGSFGATPFLSGCNAVLNVLSQYVTSCTNAAFATTTMPLISVSQGQFAWVFSRGTSSTDIISNTSTPDFLHLLTNVTATAYLLAPGSSTLFYNDGVYWNQIQKN